MKQEQTFTLKEIKEVLLGSAQVAEMLGITPVNMPNKRRADGFPKPCMDFGRFPVWLKSDIEDYMNRPKERRKRIKPIERMTPEEAKAAGRLDELMAYLGGAKDENGK